jgi:hypothetical protein
MDEILDLFQWSTTQYSDGKLYDARMGFAATIRKLRTLDTEVVASHRHGCWMARTARNNGATSRTRNKQFQCQRLAYSLKESFEDEELFDATISHHHFIHLPSDETYSTLTSSQIGFFDGIVPLSHDLIHSIESFGAASIYNLAVINHVIELSKSEESQSWLLCKALHLYAQAQSLIDIVFTQNDNDEIERGGIATLLEAAIYSNMTQIYRDYFLDMNISYQLVDEIEGIVSLWNEEYILYHDIIPERYYDFFVTHVRVSEHLTIQTAPVA